MVTMGSARGRAGYALLATLWICMGIAALASVISLSAREAIASSRNRMALTVGRWLAEACLTTERETIRDALAQEYLAALDSSGSVWNYIDRVLAEHSPQVAGCSVSARSVGSHLDVNATDEGALSRVLQAAGWRPTRADSAAAALADWKDADDTPRPNGAERDWYLAHGREPPSNSPLVNHAELARVRGFETDSSGRVDSILDVEPGAIALNQAPREVLAQLPGFTDFTTREVLDQRARGVPVTAFIQLRPWLDPNVPNASAKLPGLILLTPQAWIVTARLRTGHPSVTTVIELRLARADRNTVVTRRRTWIE